MSENQPATDSTTEIQKPTPGRIVYIWKVSGGKPMPGEAAMPAGVIGLAASGEVIVDVWPWSRSTTPLTVPHVSEAIDGTLGWDWMPYQVGQAKKVEQITERRMGMTTTPKVSELARRYSYHAPKPDQPARYEAIREKVRETAILMAAACPPSDELANALDHLDNAMFNANAAIARHE